MKLFTVLLTIILMTAPGALTAQWVTSKTRVINFTAFSIGYSDSLRMPLWAHYKLTRAMLEAPRVAKRRSTPYTDDSSRRSSEFTGSGHDRGHMAPFAAFDFSNETGLETFSMYNIVPQKPDLNRGLWKTLEDYEGRLAEKLGCIYVNIDNHFEGDTVVTTKGVPLPVPRRQTKIIYNCDGVEISRHTVLNL